MASNVQVIARLDPQQLGTRHHGDCYSVNSHGTRKTAEVALASDHAGIEIYDTRSSRVLFSHTIRPGEEFTCPPLSVSSKRGDKDGRERFTYWATAESRHGEATVRSGKTRLSCLHEDASGNRQLSHASVKDVQVTAPICLLRLVDSSDDGPLVLAIHKDGKVACYTKDLERSLWEKSISGFADPQDAAVFTQADAEMVFFKSRTDIMADLPRSGSPEGARPQYLALLEAQDKSTARLRYFGLSANLSELFSVKLPVISGSDARNSDWSLHARSGRIMQVTREICRRVAISDITELVPSIKQSLEIPDAVSVLRISSSSIAAIVNNVVKVINVKWKSLEREEVLEKGNAGRTDSQNPRLLSFHPPSGALAILQSSTLFGLQVEGLARKQGPQSKKRKTGTLADAVGNGIGTKLIDATKNAISAKSLGKRFVPDPSSSVLGSKRDMLDSLQQQDDYSGYDNAMLQALQEAYGKNQDLAFPFIHAKQPDLADYAITHLFEHQAKSIRSSTQHMQLKVRRMAPETFRYLLTRGLLTSVRVEQAFRSTVGGSRSCKLHIAAVVEALALHDPSLQALIYFLSSAPVLLAEEAVVALSHALKLAQHVDVVGQSKLVTQGEEPLTVVASGGAFGEIHNGDGEGTTLEAEGAPEFDGDWPDPDPHEGQMHNARAALGSSLLRLSLCGERSICNSLKSLLQPGETLILMDRIRLELASGGWFTRIVDEEVDGESDMSSQSGQINIMVKILNCAVNSLGSTAWLLGSSGEVEAERHADKIAYMRAEISAALDGIEESASLEQHLNQVLRYAATAASKQADPPVDSVTGTEHGAGVAAVAEEGRQASMLPLGLSKADAVPKTMVRKGKEVQISRRHRGLMKSRTVPEYSFERIVI